MPVAPFEMVGLDHFAVNVRDLDASAKWYKEVLGFAELHRWSNVIMVGRGNIKVGLFLQAKATPIADIDSMLSIIHVAILLDGDKFDGALAAVRAAGIAVDGPEDSGIAFSFFIYDPDGHQIEFTTYHRPTS
ncbi:MAG: VOC family protein [Hyphomicrobiales bacterium]|nr:MAG: VOC family protein [Hyphomicrobiales bacterium]